MNLRRIEYFLSVVDAGTITAAAAHCGIAQPALSRHIQALEGEVRLKLFYNNRNRLQLTPAGRQFVSMARALLTMSRHVETVVGSLASGHITRLHLGATPSTVRYMVAPFLATLPSTAPTVLTREVDHYHVYDTLQHGIDLVISPTPCPKEYSFRVLGHFPLRAYVKGDHAWAQAQRTHVTLRELVAERVLAHSTRGVSRHVLDAAVARQGLRYEHLDECDDGSTMVALSASGHGVAVTTDPAQYGAYGVEIMEVGDATGTLMQDEADAGPLSLTLYAAWDPEHYGATTIEGLVGELQAHLKRTRRSMRGSTVAYG
ncbi:LysR family transcriptional regulator [Paraburkholderia sp. BCC1886]|uniref:LysR family transcriptional regulator n=1 Tax=Paraburkholderia sp. BCC1886 TaxID=2562670 RepID=UPI0021B2B71F|nr:LysR family transcriptional regulator [Paraburkholderia sp. BCC1886]